MTEQHAPASRYYSSRGLRLHYLDWGNESAPLLILLHGGLEHARVWDQIAQQLCQDWHVIVPDLRGHGDSQWSAGGAYAIADFVPDIAALMDEFDNPPVTLVAHSLGGNVAIHYTALFPEYVQRLCVIEGLGSPPEVRAKRDLASRREQLRAWVDKVRERDQRTPRSYPNVDAAVDRLMAHDPLVDRATATHICQHGLTIGKDGQLRWKYDGLIRGSGSGEVAMAEPNDLWQAIECPVLLIYGAKSWASNPEQDGRTKHFKRVKTVLVDDAGHNVQHHQLECFMQALKDFLSTPI